MAFEYCFLSKGREWAESTIMAILYSSQPIKMQISCTLAERQIIQIVFLCLTGKTQKNISQRDSQKKAQVPAIPHIQNLDPFSQSSEVR